MNEETYIDIQFIGKKLSPANLANKINLPIETLVSSGELGKIGRYKGKSVPYGIGLLKIHPTAETISQYSDILLTKKASLKECNVEEIIFDVDATSEGLEKISLPPNTLKNLSILNAKIQFHNNDIVNNDLRLLLAKLIMKVSTSSHPDKKKLEDLFRSAASDFETTNISTDYIYAIIILLLENTSNKQYISKKSLAEIANEFYKD